MELRDAETLSQAAVTFALLQRLPPLAIVILDVGGNLKHTIVQDGAGPLRFPIAQAKAYAAIGMGMSTRALYDVFEKGILPDRFSSAISAAADGKFAPQPGGELIYSNEILLGAIGVSGASSDQDEAVARAALRAR